MPEFEVVTLDSAITHMVGGVACGDATTHFEEGEPERLENFLCRHPRSALYLRTYGTSMSGKNIHPGSLVVIDTAIEPRFGDIALVRLNGELLLKGYEPPHLISWGPNREEIPIEPYMTVFVEGVLSSVINRFW